MIVFVSENLFFFFGKYSNFCEQRKRYLGWIFPKSEE